MGAGENLRPSLGFLYTTWRLPSGGPVDGASQGVALGVRKGRARAPRETRRSREVPRGCLKPLRAPSRKEPRCPPDPSRGVSVRFRQGSARLWRFQVRIE